VNTKMQAQGGVVWGAPSPTTPQITIDTVGGIKLKWTNRMGTDINGFSPPRFYHVWVEQLQGGVWIVPASSQHFFVSDTAWVADTGMNLGNPTDPIRFKIAPYRASGALRNTTNTTTTTTPPLAEQPQDVITSGRVSPAANIALYCCVITIIVDTRLAPTPTTPTLATAITTPSAIPISGVATSLQTLASYLATNHAGKELAIKVKQQTATGIQDLLYANSNTSITLKIDNASANLTMLNAKIQQLLPIVQERLKSASYPNYATSPISIAVQ
jgi:hypothetical protein